MNQCQLVGRLTADPEFRTTQSGKTMTTFAIAVNRRFDRDTTDFINAVAWGKTAEFVSTYFYKGQRIGITGRIQTDKYVDKDGNNRTTTKVVVDSAEFVESKSGQSPEKKNNSSDDMPVKWDEIEDEDTPF